VIEQNGGEGQHQRAQTERQRGGGVSQVRRGRHQEARDTQEEDAAQRRDQPDGEQRGQVVIEGQHPPVIGVQPGQTLDVVDHEVAGHGEQHRTRRLVGIDQTARSDPCHVPGVDQMVDLVPRRPGHQRHPDESGAACGIDLASIE
jgi:hypothetical protein